jgi:parallel beta-helix repeat protein
MLENGILIYVDGPLLSGYTNEIDESNTVNGKPVYYWKDVEGGRIPDGAGQVIVVNCTNVIVENQDINKAGVGIQIAFSSHITIKSNNCSNNRAGISLVFSNNNSITNNNCSKNLDVSYPLYSNNMYGAGIYLMCSNDNVISKNDYSNNQYGILSWFSINNTLYLNNFIDNTDNVFSLISTNRWNSKEKITYAYNVKNVTTTLVTTGMITTVPIQTEMESET